jgi:glucose-1-phosphate adenylyltransferase
VKNVFSAGDGSQFAKKSLTNFSVGNTMPRPKTLVLILAGGKGSRLEVLTRQRAKPALHFAGTYRLIDFALSNCMHSHFSDVWVVEQYQLHTLNDHLSNGRPWDLDRTYGGLQVLPPYSDGDNEEKAQDASEGGFARAMPMLFTVTVA